MPAGPTRADLLEVLLFVGIGIAAGVVAFAVVYALVRRGASGPPACGRCQYPAQGITSLTCPECGADLRIVGITSPKAGKRAWGTATAVAAAISGAIIVVGAWLSL